MNLSHREVELVVDELDEYIVASRLQKVFESTPKALVLQLRAPGTTHHLLLSAEDDDARLHLVDAKPQQPDHPSPFTMLLRKWLHGAWLEQITVSEIDRIVHFDMQAIDPDWEPTSDDEKAPRIALTLVVELLGRHPNILLVDGDGHLIATGPGQLLGDRSTEAGAPYEPPPPPPEWAEDSKVRSTLVGVAPDGSRSRLLAREFNATAEEREFEEAKRSLRSRLKRRFKKLNRRIDAIESDLEHIENADQYRRRGELLQSAYGDVESGASSVTVPDFYRDGMPDVEIPLDPARTLQENIDHYFHQYRRYSEARDKVESRLLDSIELRDRVATARQQLDKLDDLDAVESFRTELEADGRLSSRRSGNHSGPRQQKPLPPYREFRAQSGATVLVGRSANDNDTLTTSIARGRDVWLHARNWRGAHVVLRMRRDQEINSEDLIDAAILAAHFSQGKTDTVVDVTYTRAKYVRKPSGAPTGSVTVGGGSTLAVRLEPSRLERLLDTEIDPR